MSDKQKPRMFLVDLWDDDSIAIEFWKVVEATLGGVGDE